MPFRNEPFERLEPKNMLLERREIDMVRNFMFRSKDYREPHLENARRSRRLFENWKREGRTLTSRSRLQMPFGFTIIETQVPQIVDLFLQEDKLFEFLGRDPEDAKFQDSITDFHMHQLDEMNFDTTFPVAVQAMLLDGITIAKVPYIFKKGKIFRRQRQIDESEDADVKIKKVEVIEKLKDGPEVDPIQIFDFFPDWSVKRPGDIQSMRGCVHRMYKTFSELRSKRVRKGKDGKVRGIYKNLDELRFSLQKKGSDAWQKPFFEVDAEDFKQDFEHLQDNKEGRKDTDKIEIWEYWGLFDPQGDGNFQEYIITLANGDVIIRAERNIFDYQFKPFIACPNFLRDGEFYGIPELLAVESLIKEANTIRNARLDNINLSVNPMWLADRASGINFRGLYSRPNGVILTNNMEGLKPLQLPDPSLGSAQEMINIQQDIQNATAQLNSSGSLSQAAKTFGRSATGVQFINSFTQSRISLKARLLSNLYIKPMAWIMWMENRQFVDEDKQVRLLDPDAPNPFNELPQDAFFRKFDFKVKTRFETGGTEAQFAKMQAASQILQVAEQSQPGVTKFDVLLESLLRPILGSQTKRFVRTEEERQQIARAQQETNALAGRNAPQPNAPGGAAGGNFGTL